MKNNLRNARKARGYTQEEISDLFSVTQQSISNWERGLKEPDYATLIRFADLYQVTIDYLLDHANEDDAQGEYSLDEKALIAQYRDLSDQGKQYIRQQMFMAITIYKNSADVSDMETSKIG